MDRTAQASSPWGCALAPYTLSFLFPVGRPRETCGQRITIIQVGYHQSMNSSFTAHLWHSILPLFLNGLYTGFPQLGDLTSLGKSSRQLTLTPGAQLRAWQSLQLPTRGDDNPQAPSLRIVTTNFFIVSELYFGLSEACSSQLTMKNTH